MDCQAVQERIGIYLDGELPAGEAGELRAHLADCGACSAEFEATQRLIGRLAPVDGVGACAPEGLWPAIENRLSSVAPRREHRRLTSIFHRPMALAASLAILVGGSVFVGVWLSPVSRVAEASTINYDLLLAKLPYVDTAVDHFLSHYRARPMTVEAIRAAAGPLRFEIPPNLHGGFYLERAYQLDFNGTPGFAARYRRGDEPLFVFFHPPMKNTTMGVHRDCSKCLVAGHQGDRVQVGGWQLIHFTDPTTCHCLLSRIEQEPELNTLLAAISPDFSAQTQPSQP